MTICLYARVSTEVQEEQQHIGWVNAVPPGGEAKESVFWHNAARALNLELA